MILPATLSDAADAGTAADRASRHHKPRLSALLETLRLDVSYERGEGTRLYHRDSENKEIEVLDLVGGYGSLFLGHNQPVLVEKAHHLLASGRPIHAQGSRSEMAEALARELSVRAGGDYCVVFGNSGAESIEAAIKHAILETGSRTFISLERGFHGKTLGALQFTAHPTHRGGWESPDIKVLRVPMNDTTALENAFEQAGTPAGFVFEPVQGEGGVHVMDPAFAQRAVALCRQSGAAMIADECQTGLGRTGTFLACEALGIQPDYIVLAKSLGGGLAKISALLVQRERYRDTFDLKHSSTFAGDDYSCAIALKTLELITAERLEECRRKGQTLLDGLERLAALHPDVVVQARGQGLMAALEFRPLINSPSFVLRFLSAQNDLAYAIASHLLARHRIRVAPTLSDRFSLRIEPAVLISDEEIQCTLDAFESVCALLANGDAAELTRHVVRRPGELTPSGAPLRDDGRMVVFDAIQAPPATQPPQAARVAWLCHMVDADGLVSLDASYQGMSTAGRESLLAHWVSRAAPVLMSRVAIRSVRGAAVEFHPILLPFTSRWAKQSLDARALSTARALVQQGIDTAADLGCSLVSLGQYTSILTANGTRLDSRGLGITTGNSYAIALALQAVERACAESGVDPASSTAVIVGASGNIGRACAHLLARRFSRLILVGSAKRGALLRLQAIAKMLPNVAIATDLDACRRGEVIVAAVNAVEAPLHDHHLAPGAIVCDLSVPSVLRAQTVDRRPDLTVIKGGIAALPFAEDLRITGFPLPAGQAYGCMAEAMLLGFEGVRSCEFTGSLTPAHVARTSQLAIDHGFHLAAFKHTCVFASDRHDSAPAIAC